MVAIHRYERGLSLFILFSIIISLSCGDFIVESKWCAGKLEVDGNDTEWRDAKIYFEGEKYTIGVKNDSTFLYVLLATQDKQLQMQILHFGFIVSFGPAGERKKSFGIRFPLENKKQDFPLTRIAKGKDTKLPVPDLRFANRGLEILQLRKMLGKKHTFTRYMLTAQAKQYGIESRVALHSKELIYELKVPLRTDEQFKYALNPGSDSGVAVFFETPEMEFDNVVPGKPRGLPGHGMLPPGGMIGGGMGYDGMRRSNMRPYTNKPTPVKIRQWVTVRIAVGE